VTIGWHLHLGARKLQPTNGRRRGARGMEARILQHDRIAMTANSREIAQMDIRITYCGA